ncbi:MAG: cation:proton antiporter [Victivallales bacterium]|nr:cation:proton antiporter [Victivallales bacterium]
MLINISIVVIAALVLSYLCEKIKLPGLLGMLLAGVLLGPSCLGLICPDLMHISAELRNAALIVILIRAGLGISRKTLNKVGASALRMSCIPGLVEGGVVLVVAHFLLNLPWLEAGMLGFIIAAVSPAVVVPQMLDLKERCLGGNKDVPTLVLAGASLDDVFAITVFYVFLNLGTGQKDKIALELLKVPVSIVSGIVIGALIGFALLYMFKKVHMRDTRKLIVFMIAAILFHGLEHDLKLWVASLLGIMTIGFVMLERNDDLAKRMAQKFNKVWVLAEILLFVLIGAQVDISVVGHAGLIGLVIIAAGLSGRSLGVFVALIGSGLNRREKLFCVFAYFPKATVQAAIGAIPLSAGIASGNLILAIAVLSIIVTAPLGAILIRTTGEKLLDKDGEDDAEVTSPC